MGDRLNLGKLEREDKKNVHDFLFLIRHGNKQKLNILSAAS